MKACREGKKRVSQTKTPILAMALFSQTRWAPVDLVTMLADKDGCSADEGTFSLRDADTSFMPTS